jgi:putative ABC transport system permease protein
MFRVAFKNLVTHKFRSLALVLTVVLGVSFVVGTYVLTDTITQVFDDIFTDVYSSIDVSVRHSSELGLDAARPPIPESLLADVRSVNGVRTAEGSIFGIGVDIIDSSGNRLGNPMAPSFGTTWSHDDALTPFTLREGRRPTAGGEVAIDARSFDGGHFHLGDSILLVTPQGPQHFTLVGVAGFGRASNLAGATISIFDLRTAQALLDRVGQFDSIDVAADTSVSSETLQERIAAAMPPEYEAVTGADLSAESSQSVANTLGFFRTFMLVFAFVALFVGAFIVYNTYSIVIAERTRELALIRALGASGLAVLGSVLIEAIITGLVASGIGVVVGVLIALGLRRLLDALDFSMPSGDLALLPRTLWIAFIGGTAITLFASLVPALRASRVPPIAAMSGSSSRRSNGLIRSVCGAALTTGGIASVLVGFDRGRLPLVGVGAVSTFVGVAMLAPLISRPVVSVLGEPVERTRGVAGLLARENARRSSRRTAATASALMVGTALMAAALVLSRSMNESVERAVTTSAVADLVVTTDNQLGFSDALATQIESMPEVGSVARYQFARFKLGNATKNLVALPSAALDRNAPEFAIDAGLRQGSFLDLPNGGIAVHRDIANSHHWQLGDVIDATLPTGTEPLRLVAVYDQNTLVGDYVIDQTTFNRAYVHTNDYLVLVTLSDKAALRSVQADIKQLLEAGYPGLKVQDRAEYIASTKARVAQFLNLVTALLVLAVGIALLGVLITMLLSVSERTREIGLVRAVGMTRRQTRSMIRWEAAIVSFFGALLGLGLGVFFGLALVRAMRRQGLSVSVVPVPQLLILALAIACLGVLASVYPARRAARLNVIEAVASL